MKKYIVIMFLCIYIPYQHATVQQQKYLGKATLEPISFASHHTTESGFPIERRGTLLLREGAQAVVMICHGFMCNEIDIRFLRMLFPYHVMAFDFRAHGNNVEPEHYCTFGKDEAYDVLGAVKYIKSRPDIGHLPIIAYGFSMGAVAVIEAQAIQPDLFKAVILDCPYDHSHTVIKKGLKNLKFSFFGYSFSLPGKWFLERYAFSPYVQSLLKAVLKTVANMDATAINTYIYPLSPVESIKKMQVPCLLIHCHNDEKVPVSAAQNLFYNVQSSYVRLWITPGRRHFDSFFFCPEKYVYKLVRFMEKVLSGEIAHKERAKIMYDTIIL